MRYAKLSAGTMEYAPRTITIGQTHYNPTPAFWLTERGYLPVVETIYPNDNRFYVAKWIEQDGQIVRVWIETEPPASDELLT